MKIRCQSSVCDSTKLYLKALRKSGQICDIFLFWLFHTFPVANPIKLFFLHFPIFDVNFECLLHIKKIIDNKIT